MFCKFEATWKSPFLCHVMCHVSMTHYIHTQPISHNQKKDTVQSCYSHQEIHQPVIDSH